MFAESLGHSSLRLSSSRFRRADQCTRGHVLSGYFHSTRPAVPVFHAFSSAELTKPGPGREGNWNRSEFLPSAFTPPTLREVVTVSPLSCRIHVAVPRYWKSAKPKTWRSL